MLGRDLQGQSMFDEVPGNFCFSSVSKAIIIK